MAKLKQTNSNMKNAICHVTQTSKNHDYTDHYYQFTDPDALCPCCKKIRDSKNHSF